MFGHLYRYRLNVLVRNNSLLFWTLIFPILLGLMFSVAFSEIDQAGTIETIPVGIIKEEQNQKTNEGQLTQQVAFMNVLKQTKSGGEPLFSLQEVSPQEAEKRLDAGDLAGYYSFEQSSIQLAIARTGLSQTILKNMMDRFLQNTDLANKLVAIDSTLTEDQLTSFLVGESFVQQENQTRNMSIFLYLGGNGYFVWIHVGGQKRPRPASKSVIQRDSPFGHPPKPIVGFFSKYPCWIHDIFLRSFSDSKCFSFYLSSRLRKPLAVVIRPIRFWCIECIIIRKFGWEFVS